MTKEEIIEMAREAGGYSPKKYSEEWRLDDDDLLRFAKLVAEKATAELRADVKINQKNLLQKLTRRQE